MFTFLLPSLCGDAEPRDYGLDCLDYTLILINKLNSRVKNQCLGFIRVLTMAEGSAAGGKDEITRECDMLLYSARESDVVV